MAAGLQVVLAVAVFPRAWWISLIFLAAAALFGRGALRGCRRNPANNNTGINNNDTGTALAVIAPLAIGISGIEPFAITHHLVRVAVLGGMLVAWLITRPSATSPAQSA